MTLSTTHRYALHAAEVRYLGTALRRRGCTVVRTPRHVGGHVAPPDGDLVVDGQTVGVAVAHASNRDHGVTVSGRHYSYAYDFVVWNLHVKCVRRRPVLWVLVLLTNRVRRRFVVPGELLRDRYTIEVRLQRLIGPTAGHWLCAYRGRLDLAT